MSDTYYYLPAEIDEAFEAALCTDAAGPKPMQSYLAPDDNNALPKIPMVAQRKYQAQMRDLLYFYLSTPGMCDRELTYEEEAVLTPFEIGIWNIGRNFKTNTTDFTERKWIAEMLMGPVVQRNENVNLNVTQDWREEMREKGAEVAGVMAFAEAMEAQVRDVD